jgi:hypothetical protein
MVRSINSPLLVQSSLMTVWAIGKVLTGSDRIMILYTGISNLVAISSVRTLPMGDAPSSDNVRLGIIPLFEPNQRKSLSAIAVYSSASTKIASSGVRDAELTYARLALICGIGCARNRPAPTWPGAAAGHHRAAGFRRARNCLKTNSVSASL